MNTRPITDQTQDQLAVTRWRLDPAASSAEFQVPHFWGLITVKGHFDRLDGRLEIDESRQLHMMLTIDAASLHTSSGKRDKHLRSAAFFDTQNHPEVRFRSTSVSDAGEARLRVERELEVAGERVPLRLIPDPDRAVAARYGTGENGGLFVIRPDGYIASRSDQR